MSDEEYDSDDSRRQNKKKIAPLPKNHVRFTDLSPELVDKAIRCKCNNNINIIRN